MFNKFLIYTLIYYLHDHSTTNIQLIAKTQLYILICDFYQNEIMLVVNDIVLAQIFIT